jgi:hypothetical protein
MALWQLPEPQFKPAAADGEYLWKQIDAYGVIPCARQAQAQRFEGAGQPAAVRPRIPAASIPLAPEMG